MQPDVLPHDTEAEFAVLALVLQDPKLFRDVAGLPGEAFFEPLYREIFLALKKLYRFGRSLSLPLVKDILSSGGLYTAQVEEILLSMSVRYTLADVPVLWEGYKEKLFNSFYKRIAIQIASEIQADAQNNLMDAKHLLEKTKRKVQILEERLYSQTQDVLTPADLKEVLSAEIRPREIPKSLLSSITKGFLPGELVLIAARPAVGKTALLLAEAYEIASAGYSVLFVSREMTEWELMQRLNRYTSGRIHEEMPEHFFVTTTARTPSEIAIAARQVKAEFVFVDYVQRLSADIKTYTREQEVGAISQQLKDIALDLGIVVVAAAQLNRELEKRENREPYLSDLRDSGRLEQDANQVLLLWRDPLEDEEPYTVYWKLAKNRRGPTARGEVQFVPSEMQFFKTM